LSRPRACGGCGGCGHVVRGGLVTREGPYRGEMQCAERNGAIVETRGLPRIAARTEQGARGYLVVGASIISLTSK